MYKCIKMYIKFTDFFYFNLDKYINHYPYYYQSCAQK